MTELLARLCAAVVGAVFAVAAAGKFLSMRGWITDARGQGIPRALAMVVPPLELVLGVGLVAMPAASTAAALVLGVSTTVLMVFTAFIVVSVASGRRSPCACFGSRSRREMSSRDVLRNIGLIALLACSAALQ